jgi:hypothetical protein
MYMSRRLDTLVNGRNTISQVLVAFPRNQEASIPNHTAELLLAREPRDRLDEVLIRGLVASHHLSNVRDSVEGPLLVDGVEQRVLDLAELKASEDTARLQHPERLLEGNILVCEVPDAEGDGVEIDRVIRNHVQLLCICLDEPQARTSCIRRLQTPLLALGQHVGVDVCDGDVGVGVVVDVAGVVEHAECDVARATGDVKDVPALVARGRGGGQRVAAGVQVAHEVVFPQAVDTQRHEVVHRVVRGGDRGEDAADCASVNPNSLCHRCTEGVSYPAAPSAPRRPSRSQSASSHPVHLFAAAAAAAPSRLAAQTQQSPWPTVSPHSSLHRAIGALLVSVKRT